MHNNNRNHGGGRGGQRRYNNNRGGYRNNSGGGNAYNEDGINQHQLRNASNLRNKYLGMARDAAASGDRVLAENYLQHADHYVRLLGMQQQERPRQPQGQDQQPPRDRFAQDEDRATAVQGNNASQDEGAPNAAFGEHLPAFLYGRVVSGSGHHAPQNSAADTEETTGQ